MGGRPLPQLLTSKIDVERFAGIEVIKNSSGQIFAKKIDAVCSAVPAEFVVGRDGVDLSSRHANFDTGYSRAGRDVVAEPAWVVGFLIGT